MFSNKLPQLELAEIRKRARILVIDDSEFFYLQLFEDDGYVIEKWDDVNDLHKIESGYFDIILLDIQGVGRKYSKEEGLGVLKHLHQVCPAQIIIAYSNADFSLKYQDFFRLADATLDKADDYVNFKRTVDHLLQLRFSLDFYLNKITSITNPYGCDIHKIRTLSKNAILKNKTSRLEKALAVYVDNNDIIATVLKITQKAAEVLI